MESLGCRVPESRGLSDVDARSGAAAEAERLARDGARQGLELEPASPPAQFAASLVRLLFDWDPAAAAAMARAASERDPEDLRGPIVLGLALLAEGRLEDGERVLNRGVLLDPNAPGLAYLELALETDLAAARRDNAESLAAAGRHGSALSVLATARTLAKAAPKIIVFLMGTSDGKLTAISARSMARAS